MRKITALLVCLLSCCAAPSASAQDTRRVRVSGVFDGQLLTSGDRIYARVPPEAIGVEFVFHPEPVGDVRATSITLGVDYGQIEQTFGPDCGATPCEKRVFSVALDKQFERFEEGWGRLTVREIGSGEESSVRAYWDSTPPVARFQSPRFNAAVDGSGKFEVIAHSLDEDIVAMKVTWLIAALGGRNIPRFEQHFLGFDFAQHAACVPTSVGSNLQWLQDTGQAQVVNPVFANDNKALVTALGMAMQTTSSGTGGNDARDGTAVFLFFTAGLVAGQDYTLEHLVGGDGTYGFTPQQMLEQFQAGGAVSVGFHNLAGQPGFGHVLSLSNVVLNDDGTAWIGVMDPNVEPNPDGQTVGQFRSFKLHANGKIDWDAANPGYYTNSSGQVKLDELLILRDFTSSAMSLTSAGASQAAVTPTSGEVPGKLAEGGHTFIGTFEPPPDSPGPWLLISQSTHRAGHTQRSYRLIGGRP